MNIFVPKTLRGAFAPTFIANYALAIGVIQYPLGKPRPIISAIWSIINVSIYFGFVEIADLPNVLKIAGSTTLAKDYRNYALTCGVFIAVSLCMAQVKSKMLARSFQKLNFITDRLRRLGIPSDYNRTFKTQIIQLIAAFSFIILIMILDSKYIVYQHAKKFSRICYLSAIHHWLIFNFVIDTSYTNIFRYFSNRFQRLNLFLAEPNLHKIVETSFDRRSNDLPPILKEIHGNLPLNRAANCKQGMFHLIRETRTIHWELHSTAMEMNKIFGIQLFLSLSLPMVLIPFLLFNSYVYMTRPLEISPPDEALIELVPLPWAMFYALKVFLIINTGETISREAQRTGQLIHTLLNSTLIYNEEVRDELKIFSLQLIQNPLHLTAYGLFTVDYGLARGMLGTISTSLIVMIQMQSTYER